MTTKNTTDFFNAVTTGPAGAKKCRDIIRLFDAGIDIRHRWRSKADNLLHVMATHQRYDAMEYILPVIVATEPSLVTQTNAAQAQPLAIALQKKDMRMIKVFTDIVPANILFSRVKNTAPVLSYALAPSMSPDARQCAKALLNAIRRDADSMPRLVVTR